MTRARSTRSVLLMAALILLLAPVARAAEDGAKIGVIDSQRIFSEYQEAKDAEAVFQEEVRQWRDEIEGMEREILSLQEKLRSQQLLLSQDKLDELQQQIQQKTQEYEKKRMEYFDNTEGLAVKRNQELSQPINDQITLVVERLAAEGGYDLILDTSTINVVYLAPDMDLTDKVLEELEKSGN